MTDRHFSIFRGKARSGLGEGPGSQVGLGEQYLDADKELFTEALCAEARPWLTLDAPDRALAEGLESWSCFPAQKYLFVSRSVPVRVGFDPRPTYFTHARAFEITDALAPADPGAYIGISAVFDDPWLPGARPPVRPLPPVESPCPAAPEWSVATRLLGHLYQGFMGKYPVVIIAGPGDCAVGGRLFSLVAYARAALPWAIKREYRARLFTREARLFVKQLGAHLVVIPESVAAEALEARRDALLLDARGKVVRGPALGTEALAYAEALQVNVQKLPHALLAFSARVSAHLPAQGLPTAHDVLVAQAIYNLSAAGPAQMDSLFRFLLTRVCAEAESPIDFGRFLAPEELRPVADDRLLDGLLHGANGEAVSPSADSLLRVAAASARDRKLSVDEKVKALGERPTEAERRKLAWLWRERLLSASVLATKTVTLPIALVAEILPPVEALGHERDAGLLGRREPGFDDLSTWADPDPALRDLLLDATCAATLTDRWLLVSVDRAQGDSLTELAAALLEREASSPRLTPALNRLLSRLATLPRLELRRLHAPLLSAVRRADPAGAPQRYVRLMALLDACGGLPAEILETWQQSLRKIRDAEMRRWIVSAEGTMNGVWVDQSGALLLPATWDRDVAALVLGRESLRARLSFEASARLARSAGTAHADDGAWAFVEIANREARSDLAKATSVLVNEGAWLIWRASTVGAFDPRRRAHAWLAASHAARRDAPTIEEWQAVLEDLGDSLGDDDLRILIETDASGRGRARWPWIAPYEHEQLAGLAARVRRLDHLATLAGSVDPVQYFKAKKGGAEALKRALLEVLQACPFLATKVTEPELFVWLARSTKDFATKFAYRPGEIGALLQHAGALQANVVNLQIPLQDSVVAEIAAWLTAQPNLLDVRADFLERLAAWLQTRGSSPLPDLPEIRPRPDLANALRKLSPSLVPLVDPARGQAMYTAVVGALRAGTAEHDAFKELAEEVAKWSSIPVEIRGAHPLHRLADAVRTVPLTDAALHVCGEQAFLMACSWYPLLVRPSAEPDSTYPVLDFLLALVPTEEELPVRVDPKRAPGGPGAVACRLVAHAIAERAMHSLLETQRFWSAVFASLTVPVRRTPSVPHRPVASVAELSRLRVALRPWRVPFDAALQAWFDKHAPRRGASAVSSFSRVSSTGVRS